MQISIFKPSGKRLRNILLIIWWSAWSALHYQVLIKFGLSYQKAVADSLISNILLSAFCLLIINNMRYYLPGKERFWYLGVVSIALSAIWLGTVRATLWLLYNNDDVYLNLLSNSSNIRFAIGLLMTGCVTMLSMLWYTQQEQKASGAMKAEAASLLKEAELFKLRQQLQPHFLFNSLHSISALAGSNPEKARYMIQQLSDFLRGTLKKEEKQMIPLQEELQYLQLYLDIEKIRFGNRLNTVLNIDASAVNLLIPALILQPIVENAIKFGLYDTMEEVTITITANIVAHQLLIEVTNPFDPATYSGQKGTGFGLSSVKRRLFLLYESYQMLKTGFRENLFTTTLSFPL
jgi:two-component system, LytTR family, sensor kinase